jgi:spore coat polysaccharide biosynthesis protein SpsF (cytidylyltransferase family)
LWSTAEEFKLERVIRVWGDSPLVSPEAINLCIHFLGKFEYVYTTCFPEGMNASAITHAALRKSLDIADREWFHKWAMTHLVAMNIDTIDLSVDYPGDLRLISVLC